MLFQDYMDMVARRLKEPGMSSDTSRVLTSLPYLVAAEMEQVMVMTLNQVLREVEVDDWDSISSVAVQTISGASPLAVPDNLVRVLGADVDGAATVFASVAVYYQKLGQSTRYTNQFTIFDGECLFTGGTITLRILVEPSLTDWKAAAAPILPPGCDIRVVDLASKRIIISDYVPEWRP